MKIKAIFLLAIMLTLIIPHAATGQGLSKNLQAAVDKDTVRNVWVIFEGRPSGGVQKVSQQAQVRRQKVGFKAGDDRGVNHQYIREIERRGGELRHTFAWGNAASFSVHTSRLTEIASLSFVKSVSPVAVYTRGNVDERRGGLGKTAAVASYFDPGYGWHMEMVNIPMAHEYLKARKLGDPGSGVLMAFFDSGFRVGRHMAYQRVRDSLSVVAVYDFVDGDTLVYDPDSVATNPLHTYHQSDRHGTQTLGLVAGYYPGAYIGAAWGARFALARTEDVGIEARIEEDNWAAAVIWADSLGADIISSSLGYRDGFTDTTENYTVRDMDGKTAIISIAAAEALARGMIVVNSMGNEGNAASTTITAPADVDGVVSVGAIDRFRGLAWFSSIGPTASSNPADRRMKPEVVAPGVHVQLVDPYYMADPNRYVSGNGTSFSTPIVAGIMALILQANPSISADEAKERLYRSCKLALGQFSHDNRFGYGIPDALRAMMGRNELFIHVTDSLGKPLAGAQVRAGTNTYTIDSTGNLLIEISQSALPGEFRIFYREKEIESFAVDSLPFASNIVLDIRRDEDDGLKVHPKVINRNRAVRGKYYFSGANPAIPTIATVHTLNGKKVWEQKLQMRLDGSAEFTWNCKRRSQRVAAGVYFVTVRHGYQMISERILVTE